MNLIKQKKFYQNLFVVGILLLPILEIYRSFLGDRIHFFGFAAEELCLMLWSAVLFVAGICFSFSEKRRSLLWCIGAYLVVFGLYTVAHSLNVSHFNASLMPHSAPDFFREAYYLLRMYFCPLSLILSAVMLRLPEENILFAAKGAALILSLCIIIPDLLGVSFASYRDGNVMVDGSFFQWFTLPDNAPFEGYTAKGFFSAANDIGAALFGLSAFVSYGALKKASWQNLSLLFATGLACVMVGTKIGSFGFFLSLGAMLTAALLKAIICKEGKKALFPVLKCAAVFLVLIPLLLLSPGYRLQNRRDWEKESADRPTESLSEIDGLHSDFLSEQDTARLKEYVEEHHWDHFIDPWFLELYPVENDPDFWQDIIKRDNHLNSDSRRFKLEMIHRICQQNANPADALVGIGFTSGIPYAEKDFANQYYLFGGMGLFVLIAPFFVLLAVGGVFFIRSLLKKKDLLRLAAPCLALFSFLVTAWFAGHVFDTLFTTYFLTFSSAGLLGVLCHDDK